MSDFGKIRQLLLGIPNMQISSYLRKNPNIRTFLLQLSDNISEAIWLCKNNLREAPICEICEENKAIFIRDEYKPCSAHCRREKFSKIMKASRTPEVIQKIKETNLKLRGVTTNLLTPENKALHYKDGKHIFTTKEFKDKAKNTNLALYGVDHYAKSNVAKSKAREQLQKAYESQLQKNQKLLQEKLGDDYSVISYNMRSYEILHKRCNNIFFINNKIAIPRVNSGREICVFCNPVNMLNSDAELKLGDYIESLGLKIERNKRGLVGRYEVDIWIPSLNIGIDYNGLYWHSELYKDKYYHQRKYLAFKENNIRFIQIWEHQWLFQRQLILQMLKTKLVGSDFRYYARNLEMRKTNVEIVRPFLDKNHLQGFVGGSVYYGLFNGDELVQLLSMKGEEISRICTKSNTIIVGGIERLFKFMMNDWKPKAIYSYCNPEFFNGDVYERLGLKFDKITEPNWFAFNKNLEIFSRQQLQKHKLGDIDTTADIEIDKRGLTKVYNSGNIKYFNNKNVVNA